MKTSLPLTGTACARTGWKKEPTVGRPVDEVGDGVLALWPGRRK
jgi:hypothetical protein